MSSTIRIALVAEGITDHVVIKASIESMLGGRSFDLKLLQPEGSVAFTGGGDAGALGGGWRGVYKWCQQSVDRRRKVGEDFLFHTYDLLILHLDADVAGEDPANDKYDPLPELEGSLPCEQPCPPASDTTGKLRLQMLSWMQLNCPTKQIVLCTPSKSTEAWVMAACFPHDREMKSKGWECHPEPEARLGQQPKKQRFSKKHADYEHRFSALREAWPDVVSKLSEARRFNDEFHSAIASGQVP